jgi:predicted glutamine amidotransferase
MCQMILSRHGVPTLSPEAAGNLLTLNPHGGGIAVALDGRLTVRRARHMTVDLLLSGLAPIPAPARVLVHLRHATCDPIDDAHVQPFELSSTAARAFAHNGTLPGWGSEFRSDSAHIAEELFSGESCERLQDCLARQASIWLPGNRFVLLNADSTFALVGEHEGVWRDQVWWSNPKQLS